ncbi:DHHW protein [Lachnospiraceae bacterium XBB1006]|nr:DHHW protein [Lachnospiraceae bacterium XBB1006]
MKKNIIMLGVFFLLIFAGLFGYMLCSDVKFSEDENRYLAGQPNFSAEALFSGDYTDGMNKYATDQFPLRSLAITIKTQVQKLMGVKDSNGVYFGKNGQLMLKKSPSEFKEKKFQNNLAAIEAFAGRNKDMTVSVLLAPTAAGIYESRLPSYAVDYNQKELLLKAEARLENLKNVKFINTEPIFNMHLRENLYYSTDHHWTTKGAYYAYQEFCKENGIQPVDYNAQPVSNGFYGTLYSKVLPWNMEPDTVEAQEVKGNITVSHQMGKTVTDTVYDKSKLKIKDKYQYFLGGNDGEVTIKTDNKNGKHLLVIKDSYANCFLPFLTEQYESIHVVDLRYFNDNLTMYMKGNDINEALVLYNLNNFDEDTSVIKLMMP